MTGIKSLKTGKSSAGRLSGRKRTLMASSVLAIWFFSIIILKTANAETDRYAYAGAYMKRGIGARSMAMGSAVTALADGGESVFWNPARLCLNFSHEIMAMHSNLSLDRNHDFISYSFPGFNMKNAYGFSLIKNGKENIENTDSLGNLLGYFDDSENAFLFTFSRNFWSGFSMGVNFKYLWHELYNAKADSFGFDLGFFYDASETFDIGLTIRDIAESLHWNTATGRDDSIPWEFAIGTVWKPLSNFMMSVDARCQKDVDVEFLAGAEYSYQDTLFLRMGLNDSDMTAGMGLQFERFNVDYSFKDTDLGGEHRISSTMKFGAHPDAEANYRPSTIRSDARKNMKTTNPDLYHDLIAGMSGTSQAYKKVKKESPIQKKSSISSEELELVAERLGYSCKRDSDTNVVEFSDGDAAILIID